MRRYLLFILLSVLPLLLAGQAPFPSESEIKQFTSSTTCVVFEDGNPVYNTYITGAVKEFWKITPVEFINTSVFNDRRRDPSYSFIILTETKFEKDKSNSAYNFINLLQGKDVDELGQMPEICAVPLSFADADDMEYGYKMGAILSFMQKHAQMISEDPSITGRRYLRYYNRYNNEVIGRNILVKQEDLSPSIDNIEKIRKIYVHRIEIVPEEVIVRAIEEKTPNTLILHKVGPGADAGSGYCFKMLISTDDSSLYYYNEHSITNANPDGLLPVDLKRLNRF
jgi:hypothetical protein